MPLGPGADAHHDRLDAELVHALQLDGRASIQDLAEQFGVSRDLVSHRLKFLFTQGGLRVVAAVDPGFAGHHLLTHAMVDLDGPARPVATDLARLEGAVFVSLVSGTCPLVFESRNAGQAELHETLAHARRLPGVERIRVTTYGEILKGFFVSQQRSEIELDALDHELIGHLQHDGRASYRTLADLVHLSPSSVRARVQRLIASGVIRISAIKAGGISRSRLAIGIGITARGATDEIRDFIMESQAIDFAASAHGNFDFIATLVGPSAGTLLATLEDLRALSAVAAIESWTHLDIVKEDYARTLGAREPRRG
ncbi:Lrp/AsnC family transcriptional regulator [Leucobacter sp. HY1910]